MDSTNPWDHARRALHALADVVASATSPADRVTMEPVVAALHDYARTLRPASVDWVIHLLERFATALPYGAGAQLATARAALGALRRVRERPSFETSR